MKSPILILSDCWDARSDYPANPYSGSSGHFLSQLLSQVGIAKSDVHFTRVFKQPANDVISFCGDRTTAIPGLPSLIKGKFVRKEFLPELTRLYGEINEIDPNIIIALGGTAAWAVLGSTGIKNIRGAAAYSTGPATSGTGISLRRQFKVLPTYHPSAVLREYTLRPVILADLDKGRRYSENPDLVRPQREIWIEPILDDLATFERDYISRSTRLSIDIETKGDQITCIGFAPSPSIAIVVPFFSELRPGKNYWPDLQSELTALEYVKRWCETKECVFHNGLYDMHRLYKQFGIRCYKNIDDTMLCWHSQQPEMLKSLGFLGSILTDEASWKFMARRAETTKKEN